MTTYALDSNTVSYLIRNEGNVRKNFRQQIVESDNLYAIPLVVVYEVKRWLLYKQTNLLKKYADDFEKLCQHIQSTAEMPLLVWDKAADIYIHLQESGKLIKDADILIAAYCLANDYTLVTHNAKDFNRIDELKFVDWF